MSNTSTSTATSSSSSSVIDTEVHTNEAKIDIMRHGKRPIYVYGAPGTGKTAVIVLLDIVADEDCHCDASIREEYDVHIGVSAPTDTMRNYIQTRGGTIVRFMHPFYPPLLRTPTPEDAHQSPYPTEMEYNQHIRRHSRSSSSSSYSSVLQPTNLSNEFARTTIDEPILTAASSHSVTQFSDAMRSRFDVHEQRVRYIP